MHKKKDLIFKDRQQNIPKTTGASEQIETGSAGSGTELFNGSAGGVDMLGAECFDGVPVAEGAAGGEFFERSIGVDGAEERNKWDTSSRPLPSFLPLSIVVNSALMCLYAPPLVVITILVHFNSGTYYYYRLKLLLANLSFRL